MIRDKTFKFQELSQTKSKVSLYSEISSDKLILDGIEYSCFNFGINKKSKDQWIRSDEDRVLITTKYALPPHSTDVSESVLFDFGVPTGTKWSIDIRDSGFLPPSLIEFQGTVRLDCLSEDLYIFSVNQLIRPSHTPYFIKFYVSKNYGILVTILEHEKTLNDILSEIILVSPIIKRKNCIESIRSICYSNSN